MLLEMVEEWIEPRDIVSPVLDFESDSEIRVPPKIFLAALGLGVVGGLIW